MAAGMCGIRSHTFIKQDNQNAIGFERRIGNQGSNVNPQPAICRGKLLRVRTCSMPCRTIMCVILDIWNDQRKIRQTAGGQIRREMREGNQIQSLHAAVHHFRKV